MPDATTPDAFATQMDSIVLHDLLNPMTAILGQLEMLQDLLASEAEPRSRDYLNQCLDSANQLSGMLVNLQTLNRIQAGQIPCTPARTSVTRLLHTLHEDQPTTGGRISLPAADQTTDLYVRDVADLLRSALHVLCQAALRLSRGSGITLRAEPYQGDHVRFTCRYAGPTLPQPVIDTLFTPDLPQTQREHRIRLDRARGMELVQAVMHLLDGASSYEPTDDGGQFVVIVAQR